ncbi:MAG TPA: hypothetical protein VH815_02400 [Acidobacteriota bacterium]
MRKIFFVVLLLFSAIGCFESKENYVLNPDGSGKVTIVGSFETAIPGMADVADTKEGMRQVKELLEKSKGVDAWSGVSYDRTKEGRVSFQGTAYFPDISKLDLETFGKDADLTKEGNNIVLLIEENEETEALPGKKLSADEVKTQVEKAKKQWQTMKSMMGPMLRKIKQDLTYRLPGTVESSTNMVKIDANTVNIQVDGAKLMAAMDAMMTDDAWLKKQAEAGAFGTGDSGPPMDQQELNQRLFGEKGPVKAVITGPAQPQFDYKSEVAAAKAEYTKLIEKLAKETQD